MHRDTIDNLFLLLLRGRSAAQLLVAWTYISIQSTSFIIGNWLILLVFFGDLRQLIGCYDRVYKISYFLKPKDSQEPDQFSICRFWTERSLLYLFLAFHLPGFQYKGIMLIKVSLLLGQIWTAGHQSQARRIRFRDERRNESRGFHDFRNTYTSRLYSWHFRKWHSNSETVSTDRLQQLYLARVSATNRSNVRVQGRSYNRYPFRFRCAR